MHRKCKATQGMGVFLWEFVGRLMLQTAVLENWALFWHCGGDFSEGQRY
jgi:hypothetical protein